jgi:hypothetical protein
VTNLDQFFEVVGAQIVSELQQLKPDSELRHWVVIEDAKGIATGPTEDAQPHEVLPTFMTHGVNGAAYVTFDPNEPERVLAYARVAGPDDSDVREARVLRGSSEVMLGPWERTV